MGDLSLFLLCYLLLFIGFPVIDVSSAFLRRALTKKNIFIIDGSKRSSKANAFFSGLGKSKKIVLYFSIHTPNYSSPIAQSIASGFKTLIIGISFLATFTFGFIGLGLFLVFIRSLIEGNKDKTD